MKIRKIDTYVVTALLISTMILSGCNKADNSNETEENKATSQAEIDGEDIETDYIIPDYSKLVIMSSLDNNVDLEYCVGEANGNCDFYIISTEKLDKDKIKIKFDSDIEYETEIVDDSNNQDTFFDYNLLLAYNSYKSEDGISAIDEVPVEEVDKVKDKLKLYSYYVNCKFKLSKDDIKKYEYEDLEINNIEIDYDDYVYTKEIGRICLNKDLIDVFEEDMDCAESTYYTFTYKENNEFGYREDDEFETSKKNVTLKNAEFINGETYNLKRLELDITTDGKVVSTVWEPGDEVVIPANSTVDVYFVASCDSTVNLCQFKANPITEFDFDVQGKTVKNYFKMTGTIYGFTKYETYAVLHDNIDIFNSYYNLLNDYRNGDN